MRQTTWKEGVRAGLPYAMAGFLLSLSFGVLARNAGFSPLQAIVTSLVVYAGSAQFAALSIFASGGGLGPAVAAAALVNSRFLPMGIALAPSLPGGPAQAGDPGSAGGRRLVGAGRPRGRHVRPPDAVLVLGDPVRDLAERARSSAPSPTTCSATPQKLGLDAIFPAFFLALLIAELKEGRGWLTAAVGGAIALALVPFTPVGVPVLAASLAAFLGLRRT